MAASIQIANAGPTRFPGTARPGQQRHAAVLAGSPHDTPDGRESLDGSGSGRRRRTHSRRRSCDAASPGSRNAPLAFARYGCRPCRPGSAARAHRRARTAGYLAVGPSAWGVTPIAMTSGTAVQPRPGRRGRPIHARVPLIVLSANRPYEMLGTMPIRPWSSWATSVHKKAAISTGLAETGADRREALNAQWCSATCRCWPPRPGPAAPIPPVQFDILLREPLVPDVDASPRDFPPGRPDGQPWTFSPPVTFDEPIDIDLTEDTVVIAGHGAGVHPNCEPWPTVAEPTAPYAAKCRCIRWR